MGDLARGLKEIKKGRDYKRQAIDRLLESPLLDDEDRQALLDNLRDKSITARALGEHLAAIGLLQDSADPRQRVQDWRDRNL